MLVKCQTTCRERYRQLHQQIYHVIDDVTTDTLQTQENYASEVTVLYMFSLLNSEFFTTLEQTLENMPRVVSSVSCRVAAAEKQHLQFRTHSLGGASAKCLMNFLVPLDTLS